MTRVVKLRVPESVRLVDLAPEEMERYAVELAEKALDLVGDHRISGINAVSLDQVSADVDVWAQWTRACCDSRSRIDDFVDPVVDDFDIDQVRLPSNLQKVHLESQFRTVQLEGPSHRAE